MRPVLLPAARRLWRDRSTLQFGRTRSLALVLEGLDPPAQDVLALLDGGLTREEVLSHPGAGPLLCLLEQAGLVVDADELTAGLRGLPMVERDKLAPDVASLSLSRLRPPTAAYDPAPAPATDPATDLACSARNALTARRAASVLVRGVGRIGAPLACLLSAAGVGDVRGVDVGTTAPQDLSVGGLTARDLGRPRAEALSRRLAAPPGCGPHPRGEEPPPARLSLQPPGYRPDLVVLTGPEEDDAATAALLAADGQPHLVAAVVERTGIVGPLVLPGRSPCLHCLDLTRTDLDPGWPVLAAQLHAPDRSIAVGDGVLAVAVAAQTALQVLQYLEGSIPAAAGGTLEIELPGWRWRRRSWPLHPDCGCAWSTVRQVG